MKKLLFLLLIVLITITVNAQKNMPDYFRTRGCGMIAGAAHVIDAQDPYFWTFDPQSNGITICIYYHYNKQNNTYTGPATKLRVDRGAGDLYFSNITVLSETQGGFFHPFWGLKLGSTLLMDVCEATDPQTLNRLKQN